MIVPLEEGAGRGCPRCNAVLLPPERYCPGCGADALWVATPEPTMRRIPRGLDVSHFQDQADRAATRALAVAAPVQALVRYYLRRVAEPEYRNQLLGNALRVTASQAPRVHRLARYCERILHTAPVEVYVSTSADVSAFTFGSGNTDVIVLTTALVDFVPDDDELLFLIGRQLGHVKADHVVYMTVAKAMGTALRGIPALGGALSSAVGFLMVPWERTAALTADRAGLLCCQDLVAAARAILKTTLGFTNTINSMNIAEFLDQARELERSGDWGDTWKSTPALGRRVRNLEDFRQAPSWDRIFEASWDPLAPRFPCYFCPGAGVPPDLLRPLSSLRCQDCGRDLKIDEVPCPGCCDAIPVKPGQGLADLTCPTCERPFLPKEQRHLFRGALPDALVARSHYRVLGVHPSAPASGIRKAFREQVAPLEDRVAGVGGGDPVQEKIRLYAAFKALIDPKSRSQHDQMLEHGRLLSAVLEERSGGPKLEELPRCRHCDGSLRGPVCGLCGTRVEASGVSSGALLDDLSEQLRLLAKGGSGEFLTDPRASFDCAFHLGRRSLFFRRCQDLDRPGTIRQLLRSAADLAAASRPAALPAFYGVCEGRLDPDLFWQLVKDQPVPRGGRTHQVALLARDEERGILCLRAQPEGLAREHSPTPQSWIHRELGLEEAA